VAGFPWDLEDYLEALVFRSALSSLLPELEGTGPRIAKFGRVISQADESVKQVLTQEAFPKFPQSDWWLRKSPEYAAERFCIEFKSTYGIEVRPHSLYDESIKKMRELLKLGRTNSEVLLFAKESDLYVASRPALFYRAVTEFIPLDRIQRRTVQRWISGEVSDMNLGIYIDNSGTY